MQITKNNVFFISVPVVPYEMKSMIVNSVVPFSEKEFNCPIILKKTLMTYGVG